MNYNLKELLLDYNIDEIYTSLSDDVYILEQKLFQLAALKLRENLIKISQHIKKNNISDICYITISMDKKDGVFKIYVENDNNENISNNKIDALKSDFSMFYNRLIEQFIYNDNLCLNLTLDGDNDKEKINNFIKSFVTDDLLNTVTILDCKRSIEKNNNDKKSIPKIKI